MKSVKINFYEPKEVFCLSKTTDHPMYGYDLAKTFYKVRYDNDGNFSQLTDSDNFVRNAGAVQLFDKSTNYPISWKEGNIKKGAFLGISTSIKISGALTSYGHSERICMRDLLDSYMNYKNIDPHDIKNPSHSDNIKDKNNFEYDILKGLKENASIYKSFLVGSGVVVKLWSERVACDYKTGDGSGGKCTEFIKNICPTGSKYGYITETKDITVQTDKIKERNELASTNLKTAYEVYNYVNTLIQNILQNFESKVDDKASKQLQTDNNIQISNLTQRFNDLHINQEQQKDIPLLDDYMDNNYWKVDPINIVGMSLDDLIDEIYS